MWDNTVKGCQLQDTGFKKAHFTPSQLKPP